MSADSASRIARPDATFAELFTPKLVTVLREGYNLESLRADATAGLTVAIVALPLSMAIAIASGAAPERGLYTAVVGGFLISLLGGSRFQIGGPAAAFTAIVATTIHRHGLDGLFLATIMAGVFLMALGLFRLGSYVKFIPYPVIVGFISGIAVILFASQIHDLLGLTLSGEPAEFLPKLTALGGALSTLNPAAAVIASATVAAIVGCKRFLPRWPAILIAVVGASALAFALKLPVETIGTRFGGISSSLAWPSLPSVSLARMREVLPDALSFALLGAIESLLSAMVADGMTGRRHRSNVELVAQGVANIGAALFAFARPGPWRGRPPTFDPGRAVPSPAFFTPAFSCCSCWSPRRSRAIFRWRRWPACWLSCPGTWRKNATSSRCFARRGATPWCCSRLSD
jgi:SulP family sulfate permease